MTNDGSVSREALDRIIKRAAELQASERDLGDSLSEDEVKQLGRDVGLPARFVEQALIEERHRVAPSNTRIDRLMGPAQIQARRTVPGSINEVSAAVEHCMTDIELLNVKRRFPDRTSWEPKSGIIAGFKRAMGQGGKEYVLSRAREIVTQVDALEDGWCHVTLSADLSNSRLEYGWSAAAATGGGGMAAGIVVLMGFAAPVAVLPVAVGGVISFAVLRARHGLVEKMSVALEQILDGLERGEIRKPRPEPPKQGLLPKAIVDEFRKHLRP